MLKIIITFIALTAIVVLAKAQIPFADNKDSYQITYTSSSNGKPLPEQNKLLVYTNKNQTLLTSEKDFKGNGNYPFEVSLIDRNSLTLRQYALLSDANSVSTVDTATLQSQKFELLNETKKILGYVCKKAKTVISSNTIELWYTTDLGVKGAPTVLGQDLGLVLEMVRNQNFTITADAVKKVKYTAPAHFVNTHPKTLDGLSYRDEIWRSRFTTIPLFTNQTINFSDSTFPESDLMRFAHGTIVVKKIKFPAFEKNKLLFLDLKEQSNGDAYDRTGTVFLVPANNDTSFFTALKNGINVLPVYENGNGKKYQGVAAMGNYKPPVELMRFFTPFGVHHFNQIKLKGKDWADAVHYRQDISAYSSLFNEQEVYIGVFIGNYDKGGHKITTNITLHDNDVETPKTVLPLFNTLNIMEMAGQDYATMFDDPDGLKVHFDLKVPIENAALRFTTTGHGGWGQGDEFVPKENTVLLDGKEIFKVIPWREDCGGYRLSNPASGNFGNGLSSSDLSRSNWCPGTVTNPYIIRLGNLPAGKHTIQVLIPQGAKEGNSFNSWNVSGVIIGD